jgi:hypothetical protein
VERLSDGSYACRVPGCCKTFNSTAVYNHASEHPDIGGKVHVYSSPQPDNVQQWLANKRHQGQLRQQRYAVKKRVKIRHGDNQVRGSHG